MKILDYNSFLLSKYLHMNKNLNYSPMGSEKLYEIYKYCKKVEVLEGCSAEVGVFGGDTSYTISKSLPNKQHYAYDTYSGIVYSGNEDYHKDGEFKCSLEHVKNHHQEIISGLNNIIYIVGKFPDTFDQWNNKFSIVHLDTDTYYGTKTGLDIFFPLLTKGGVIVVDDFDWERCEGVTKACNEFRNDVKNRNQFIKNGNQFIIIKEK